MPKKAVGIIVNAFSGKDLRRITSSATVVGNSEKSKKVERMIRAMDAFGVTDVYLMPDSYMLNSVTKATVERSGDVKLKIHMLDFIPIDQPSDTLKAIHMMLDEGIQCLVVLGGDGTSRLAASIPMDIPMIPVSTGTNNAYPKFWEGTNVGVAVSYLLEYGMQHLNPQRCKMIEIYKNGVHEDVAVMDALITRMQFTGARVVSEISDMTEIIVCGSSPDMIGFASMVGSMAICEPDDNFGYRMRILEKGGNVVAIPIASGKIEPLHYSDLVKMELNERYKTKPGFAGTIALDGERTVQFMADDELEFVITRNGPYKVDVREVLYDAVKKGYFTSLFKNE